MANTRHALLLRSVEERAEAQRWRAAISWALVQQPMNEPALRAGVQGFVAGERDSGVPPATVFTRLAALVDDAEIASAEQRHALTRRMMLWCLEDYFDRDATPALENQFFTSASESTPPYMSVPEQRSTQRLFDQYRGTALWAAVGGIIADLAASRELTVNTAPDYVTGYLCRELVAGKLIVASRATT